MNKKYISAAAALIVFVMMSGCKSIDNEPAAAANADVSVLSRTAMETLPETRIGADTAHGGYGETASELYESIETVPVGGDTEPSETYETETPTETEVRYVGVESISLTFYSVTLRVGESKMPIVTVFPENASDKREVWTSSDPATVSVDELGRITAVSEGNCMVKVTSEQNPEAFAEVEVTVTAGVQPTCIDGILVVNKTYALPADFNPGADAGAKAAFDRMQADAAEEGINIYISSGFRSYDYQAGLYQRYVDKDGKAEADRYSARAGHSEHQTGLAFDLNSIDESFADTKEGKWVNRNCCKYGFIIRYPADKEDVTGYKWEPWHIRYLGEDTAKAVYDSGLCLEEYLGITSEYAE